MSQTHHDPSVILPEGFAIGYHTGNFGRRSKSLRLAETANRISLESGRHLLLARNGRGKTTLLKTIAGILPSLSGKVSKDGMIQFVDEDLRFDEELRAKNIFSALFSKQRRKFAFEMADEIELDVEKPYGKLSKGNRQKVGLILAETRANDAGPQILLLDEPFSGLDFAARNRVDAIWDRNRDSIVRIVCVHPDEPTLKADTALIIRDQKLEQVEIDGTLDWLETRTSLN